MNIFRKIIFCLILIFPILLVFNSGKIKTVYSAEGCPKDDPCKDKGSTYDKVNCYSNIISVCTSQRESMAAQIVYLNTNIELTNAKIESAKEKIAQLQKDIEALNAKIELLENTLTRISQLLIDRINATYRYGGVSYFDLLLTSNGFSDFINRFKYIQIVQAHDRKILFQLQNSKENYKEQKNVREEKKLELDVAKKQLEKEQATLAMQKKEKQLFLETTKNSETRYRQELEAARKEAENIQRAASILSSAGVPERINRGDAVGIMGNTGFSTGAHLHLSIYDLRESDLNKFNFNSGYDNPFNSLISKELVFEPNSCDDVHPDNRQTKRVGSGGWEWPMVDPLISQCYGNTPWSWRYATGVHNGVDMYNDNNKLIRAIESGNKYTYRGGQKVGNGVFIFHDNGKMSLYWHLE